MSHFKDFQSHFKGFDQDPLLAYLREIASSVPDHCNQVSLTIQQVVILFVGGGFCLQFI